MRSAGTTWFRLNAEPLNPNPHHQIAVWCPRRAYAEQKPAIEFKYCSTTFRLMDQTM